MSQKTQNPADSARSTVMVEPTRSGDAVRVTQPAIAVSALRPDALADVRRFGATLVDELERCVAVVDADAEAALWRARRAVEAIVCVLICAHQNRAHKNDGEGEKLHGQIVELRKNDHITEAVDKKLQTVRSAANVGTHVRRDGAEAAADLVGDVRKPLADLVRWLFTESAARDLLQQHGRALELSGALSGERAHQARVQTELEAVRHAHRAELAQLRAEHAHALQALREENAALVVRERDLHTAIAGAESRVQAADKERKAAEALAKQRTIEVEAAKKKLAEALQRVENPGFFATLSRTVRFLAVAG
ncbi:MAG: hypothetical protein RL071_39, partial [Pseudomonadota bacterium]